MKKRQFFISTTLLFISILGLSSCAQKSRAPSMIDLSTSTNLRDRANGQTNDHAGGYKGHGADSLSQETLDRFAPKPLDKNLLTKIEAMLDVRTPSAGQLSPDAKTLFVNWSVTGSSQIWKVPGPKSFPIQMTGGNDSSRLQGISPDGKLLVITRDKGGNEYPGLFLQPVDGGPLQAVFQQKKAQVYPSHFSKNGRYLYYRTNARDASSYDIFKFNLKTRQSQLVFEGKPKGYWYVSDNITEDTGEKLLLSLWKGNTSSEFYIFDLATKTLTPVLGQGEDQEYDLLFGQDSKELIVLTNKFEEFRRLYSYSLKDKKFKAITSRQKNDISRFSIDKSRTKIMFHINKQGYTRLGALDLKTKKPIRTPKISGEGLLHTYFGSTTKDGRYSTMKVVRSQSPSTSYVYDWKTGNLKKWVLSSAPEIDTSEFVTPTLEHYTARDGIKIPMFLMRPKQCQKHSDLCPVVVNFHGGPESQAKPWFSPTSQLYMNEGFIRVSPNVRGSDGYGKTWLHSDNGAKRLDVITDIQDIAIFIKKNWSHNGVAPKIAATGGSYGGYSTFYAMTKFAGAFDAGVAVVGMSSLVTFLQNTAPYRRKLRESEYGYLDKDMEALKKLSPITYIDQIQSPLLIVHGATDPRVPAGEAVQFYKKMEEKGLDGELILFADEGHGVRKRPNRAMYTGHILRFLNKHLKPGQEPNEDSSPIKTLTRKLSSEEQGSLQKPAPNSAAKSKTESKKTRR